MKSKWLFWAIMLTTGLMISTSQYAHADTWATTSIDQVGQDFGNSTLRLTDSGGVFTEKWFKLRADNRKEMLAVALTALSLGKDVNVLIDTDGVTLNSIKVNK